MVVSGQRKQVANVDECDIVDRFVDLESTELVDIVTVFGQVVENISKSH